MNFRVLSFLALTLSPAAIHAQSVDNQVTVLSESYASFEETVGTQSNLRRGLQTTNQCRPTMSAANIPLSNANSVTCNMLPNYPCSCTGSTETSCGYCMIRTNDAFIHCQVSGSSVTFADSSNTVTTCGCEYIGNGQVQQNCYQSNSMVPIPAPAVVATPAPYSRTPTVFVPTATSSSTTTSTGGTSSSSNGEATSGTVDKKTDKKGPKRG